MKWGHSSAYNLLCFAFLHVRLVIAGVVVGVHPRARHSEDHQRDHHAALEGHAKDRSSHVTTCLRCLPQEKRQAWRGVVVSTVESSHETLVVLREITPGTLGNNGAKVPAAVDTTVPTMSQTGRSSSPGSPSTISVGSLRSGHAGKSTPKKIKLLTVPASQLRPLFSCPQDLLNSGWHSDGIARCCGRGGTCGQSMAQLPAHGRSAGLQCLRPECCAYMEGIADDKQGSLQPVYLCSDCAHDRACMVPDAIKQVKCSFNYLKCRCSVL